MASSSYNNNSTGKRNPATNKQLGTVPEDDDGSDDYPESEVSQDGEGDVPPRTGNAPPGYSAPNGSNSNATNNQNRRGTNASSTLQGRINNDLNSQKRRSTQNADSESEASMKSIDSQTKENMLRSNRERDGNGLFGRARATVPFNPFTQDFVRTLPGQRLTRQFVEDHAVELTHIPFYWSVATASGPYFGLKLKMCQLQRIVYDFEFGAPTGQPRIPNLPSLVERPDKCLKADFSLNDLQELSYESVQPFPNLRHLDASLNRIENYQGIEQCADLVYVNLSHNFIRQIAHISNLRSLSELNLSMNDIREVSSMPALSNLTVLHLNNNRLASLDGIQALPRLNELHVQKNKLTEIQPLATSFSLKTLNASDNHISSLHDTLVVLQALTNLSYLYLHDNPIQMDRGYANAVKQLTTAQVLDNVPLRPESLVYDPAQGTLPLLNNRQYDSLGGIRHATEHVFQQQIENHKRKTMNYINQLQRRIRELQEDYVGYENRLKRDLNDVLKNYDSFQYELTDVPRRDQLLTPGEQPWAGASLTNRRKQNRDADNTMNKNLFTRRRQMEDRKKLRDPSEILSLAARDLKLESTQAGWGNRFAPRDESPTYRGGRRDKNVNEYRGRPNATRDEFMAF